MSLFSNLIRKYPNTSSSEWGEYHGSYMEEAHAAYTSDVVILLHFGLLIGAYLVSLFKFSKIF